eukprot:EG_transcript_42320
MSAPLWSSLQYSGVPFTNGTGSTAPADQQGLHALLLWHRSAALYHAQACLAYSEALAQRRGLDARLLNIPVVYPATPPSLGAGGPAAFADTALPGPFPAQPVLWPNLPAVALSPGPPLPQRPVEP